MSNGPIPPAPDVAQLLSEFAASAGLPVDVIATLATVASVRQASVGESICREGIECTDLFFVVSGQIGLDMYVPGRGQVRILSLGSGDVVAWTAVVDGRTATASATATGETTLIVLPGRELADLLNADHEFGFHFMHWISGVIARRLVATRLQLLDLFAEEPAS